MTSVKLPIVIDMAFNLAFIKSDPRLFVFHRFKQSQRLTFAHLALFLLFGFSGHLLVFIGGLFWAISCSAFDFAREFLLRRFCRGRGGVLLIAFARRRFFVFSFARTWGLFS